MMRNFVQIVLVAVALSTWFLWPALAADLFEPHPYPAELKPYEGAPELLKMTPDEQALLKEGNAVLRQSETNESGSGVAVQFIAAPASLIWDTILRYDQYKDWVKNVDECKVYRSVGNQLFVAMDLSFWWINSKLYTVNTLNKTKGYMSWELDRGRTSDVIDLVGYWRIEEVSTSPSLTRVEYATEMVVGRFPDFIVNFLTRDSLTNGTEWVKERAEEEWRLREAVLKSDKKLKLKE
jgi:ribosome-associated toxin RatA of RatAB toxin-antitoxin module